MGGKFINNKYVTYTQLQAQMYTHNWSRLAKKVQEVCATLAVTLL